MRTIRIQTRMVQLPATAAIEYVAAVDACLIYIISSVYYRIVLQNEPEIEALNLLP